jgi:hypothetical protein
MVTKTNCAKNGNEYYRVTATIGRDSNGKPIRKEFYGKGKEDAESKRDEYLNKLLKSFFNYAVDERYILKNPCSGKKIAVPENQN